MNLNKTKGLYKSRNSSNSKPCLSYRKKLNIINEDSLNQNSKNEIYPNYLLTAGNINQSKLRLSLNPNHSHIKNLKKAILKDSCNKEIKEIKDYEYISEEESEHKYKNEQNIDKNEKIKQLDVSSSGYDEDSIILNYTDGNINTPLIKKNIEVIQPYNIKGKKYNKQNNKNYNIIHHKEKSLKDKEIINLDMDKDNLLTYDNNQEIKFGHHNLLDKEINTKDGLNLKKNEKNLNDNNKIKIYILIKK